MEMPALLKAIGGERGREIKRLRRRVKALERKVAELSSGLQAIETPPSPEPPSPEEESRRALVAEHARALTGKPLAGKILQYGLQGSGNVIAQHILTALLPEVGDYPLMRDEAIRGHTKVVTAFTALGEVLGAAELAGPGYGGPWTLIGQLSDPGDAVILPEIRSPALLCNVVHGLHSLPERRDIEAITRNGGRAMVMLRHPLDVVASCAAKETPHDAADRKAERNRLLASPDFLPRYSWQLEAWWLRFAELADLVEVIRYEDLLADPRGFVNEAAARAGVEVLPATVDSLTAKVGSTELAAKGHLFQAKAGGWVDAVPPAGQAYFEKIRPIAARYGYEWPARDYAEPVLSEEFNVVAWCFQDPRVQAHLIAREMLHQHGGVTFVCRPDSKWRPALTALLGGDPSFAATLADYRPPIPWGGG